MRPQLIESLESRQLLHGGFGGGGGGFGGGGFGGPGGPGGGPPGLHSPLNQTVPYSTLSTAIQTGLQALATTAGYGTIDADTDVALGNIEGKSTYSVTLSATGVTTKLTVDATGTAISKPSVSTTTYGDLTSAGTGTYDAAIAEITAIASALSLTAPTDDTVVTVRTTTDGQTILSVKLDSADSSTVSSTTDFRQHGTIVSVDLNGNPVGDQKLPASVIPSTILDGLAALAPTGADAATTVRVRTVDGVTLYSATYTTDGTETTVTVKADGTAASLPSDSTTTFSAITAAAQAEIKTLAAAKGVTEEITDDTEIAIHTEADGTVLYTVTLDKTSTDSDGDSRTITLAITVDADGNPALSPIGSVVGSGKKEFPGSSETGDDSTSSSEGDDTGTCPTPPTSGESSSGDSTSGSTSDGSSSSGSSSDSSSVTATTNTLTKAEKQAAAKAAKAEAAATRKAAAQAKAQARAEKKAAAAAAKAAAKLAKLASTTHVTAG